jgi:hypothetical protein
MLLCRTCHRIFRGGVQQKWQRHHRSTADLYRAARRDCYICEKLVARLVEDYWSWYTRHGAITMEELTVQAKARLMWQDVKTLLPMLTISEALWIVLVYVRISANHSEL